MKNQYFECEKCTEILIENEIHNCKVSKDFNRIPINESNFDFLQGVCEKLSKKIKILQEENLDVKLHLDKFQNNQKIILDAKNVFLDNIDKLLKKYDKKSEEYYEKFSNADLLDFIYALLLNMVKDLESLKNQSS